MASLFFDRHGDILVVHFLPVFLVFHVQIIITRILQVILQIAPRIALLGEIAWRHSRIRADIDIILRHGRLELARSPPFSLAGQRIDLGVHELGTIFEFGE